LERSTDGGKTWKRAAASSLAPIVRLGIDGAGNLYTIGGTGQDCSTHYTAYSAAGEVAESTGNPLNVWFPRPKDPDQVYGPGGTKAAPCEDAHVVGMASLNTADALLVCSNGLLMTSADSGKSWEEADELPGTMAVGSGQGRFWVAGEGKNCDGVAVRALTVSDGEVSRGPTRCAPASKVTAGGVALDVSGDTVWLWAGNKVRRSTDGGRTWS
jgi:hypothetical protein